ncbi:hypothetical protein F5884DRAFT_679219 [Xylogone sp. PMI_703]|nr:hypothetical protein F5884DRAFT_679219 [Xylogone sp. PMI_703]
MSGVEFIVSTLLATIPLALEAYDRSGRVFEVFSVLRQYPREVLILEAKLGAQRTVFRNNAINLLTTITNDRVKVQDVMNQPSSAVARQGLVMSSIYRRQVEALDESFVACRQTAQRIQDALQQVCGQAEAFRADLGQRQAKTSPSDWLKYARNRFKLSLNKPRIEKAISELRDYNRDFGLITEQINKALQEISNEQKEELYHRKSARYLNTLQKYHQVRFASKALYSTLQMRWMCSSHPCHVFDLRIISCDTSSGKWRLNHHVTCELAITHDDPSLTSESPLRLEIEQACEEHDEGFEDGDQPDNEGRFQELTDVLESSAGRFAVASPRRARKVLKSVRMRDNLGAKSPDAQVQDFTKTVSEVHLEDPTSMATTAATARPVPDLRLVEDFCKAFHEVQMNISLGRSLLGLLKGHYTQLFYLPPPQTIPLGTSQSLSEMVAWIAEEPVMRSLPRPLLVELAGNLAEGIMQVYSTPWLSNGNLGQNVRIFYPSDPSAASTQLKGPYFIARVDRAKAKGKIKAVGPHEFDAETSRQGATPKVDFAGARNKLLFNFGILLLEIGFCQPWHVLKKSVSKSIVAMGEGLSDYRTAEKLAQLLINQMGVTYSKIVKKCLGCDFGLGETDLDNEDLQRKFLEDVVSGLQQLREDMREMNSPLSG